MTYFADSGISEAAPETEQDVLRRALAAIQQRLPAGWALEPAAQPAAAGARAVDAVFVLRGPDGAERTVLVEAKRLLNSRDVAHALWQLEPSRSGAADATPMLVARYLAPPTRERIAAMGASYADATGNLHLAVERPALFLRDVGADRDPWRGRGRPRDTLKGPPAARVVRALIDFTPPYTVTELATRAGASNGAAYRLVDFAEQEGLIERQRRGSITAVDWRSLLLRWSRDYSVQSANRTQPALAPRGVRGVLSMLAETPPSTYAITGSLAAERFAPYAPARAATIYVDDVDAAMEELDLRPVDTAANVILASGPYDVVFERTVFDDEGRRYVAPSQAAVDLLTGPGRNPSEGEALIAWMQANESAWRR